MLHMGQIRTKGFRGKKKRLKNLCRNYNEDRVSIILNIMQPSSKQSVQKWPKCSFFGIYDGHGGSMCADFLKDYLHQMVRTTLCDFFLGRSSKTKISHITRSRLSEVALRQRRGFSLNFVRTSWRAQESTRGLAPAPL